MILLPLLLACSLGLPQGSPLQSDTLQTESLQEAAASPGGIPAPSTEDLGQRSLVTLSALDDTRESKRQQLADLREELNAGKTSPQQLQALQALQLELSKLNYDFEAVATGIDVRSFNLGVDQEFNLTSELEGLVKPLVSELRSATEAPREMERLRAAMKYAQEHEVLAKDAVSHLDGLLTVAQVQVPPNEALLSALKQSSSEWRGRLRDLRNQRTVAKFQLDQRTAQQTSVVDAAQSALADFFRTRGLHLGIALGTFLLILFILRSTYRAVANRLRKESRGERKFYSRLIDVLYFALSGIAALGGALLVLYSAGDWAMLGLILLLFLGIAWAGKAAVPMFVEQIRLLLNLGTVREGERIIFEGLPWRVTRLSMNAWLLNEELEGGDLRLPLHEMTQFHSRVYGAQERWFPTSKGDWVLMDGDRLAQVVHQSTEMVTVQLQGGSRVNYPTLDFLGTSAENLSLGFRAQQRFGIDYEHQGICTGQVPTLMQAALEEKLNAMIGPGLLCKVQVEFLEAAASSLDYAIMADFEGEAAPRYNEINRALQRFLVETCNENGWGIPFAQLTIHQAAE